MSSKKKRQASGTELIVALDYPEKAEALAVIDQLEGLPLIYKIGSELFLAGGPQFVTHLVKRELRIFLDLKFYDIPNTVSKAALVAAELGVEMFTLHLSGGEKMIRATAEKLDEYASEEDGNRPKVLGVSVLTSFEDEDWGAVTEALSGVPVGVTDSVRGLVSQAENWGVDGVVCSAHELKLVRGISSSIYTIVPGVRPEGFKAHDQARVVTPSQAAHLGADAIVMGRPITEAEDPKKIAEAVLLNLKE